MNIRWPLLAHIMLTLSVCAVSQTAPVARTSGYCSPSIAGSSNAKVTITCTMMSADKANKMIALMNRILSERIDLDAVNKQLDTIQKQVGDIGVALNPLAHLPPYVVERINHGKQLSLDCSAFMSTWGHDSSAAMQNAYEQHHVEMQAYIAAQKAGQRPQTMPKLSHEPQAQIDAKYATTYQKDLKPELEAWRLAIISEAPDLASRYPEFVQVHNVSDMGQVCTSVALLGNSYYNKEVAPLTETPPK